MTHTGGRKSRFQYRPIGPLFEGRFVVYLRQHGQPYVLLGTVYRQKGRWKALRPTESGTDVPIEGVWVLRSQAATELLLLR